MQPERLNPERSKKDHVIVRTELERFGGEPEVAYPADWIVSDSQEFWFSIKPNESNRLIDAKISFYGIRAVAIEL